MPLHLLLSQCGAGSLGWWPLCRGPRNTQAEAGTQWELSGEGRKECDLGDFLEGEGLLVPYFYKKMCWGLMSPRLASD